VQGKETNPEPPGSIPPGPHVISIQSQIVHGHVGNSAAVFPMQALGVTVAAVPTTLLSNHPLYPTTRGRVLEAALVKDLLIGVEERGLIEATSLVVTGYLGSPEIGSVVADFVTRAKSRKPDLVYVCDPVIGDEDSGVFVAEGLIGIFRDLLVPAASIATPNQFEFELLSDARTRSAEALRAAAMDPRRRWPRRIVVTGSALDDTPSGHIETIVCDGLLRRIAAPRLPIRPNGAGDLFAGLLAAHLALGEDLARSSEAATASVFKVLQRTLADHSYELRLCAADFCAKTGVYE
jgi:pyridoxine kinase